MNKNQSTHLRHSKMSVRELLLLVEILCYNYAIRNHWGKIGKRKKGQIKENLMRETVMDTITLSTVRYYEVF